MSLLRDEIQKKCRALSLTALLLLSACLHAPRSSYFPDKETAEQTPSRPAKSQPAEQPRFRDTSFQRIVPRNAPPLRSTFENVQADFNEGQFDSALKGCQQLMETLDDSDSLHAEARFLAAECQVQKNRLADAQELLQSLILQKNIDPNLRERSLLRLGQVYCLQNQLEDASKTFAEFKRNFSSSPLLRLATCNAVK